MDEYDYGVYCTFAELVGKVIVKAERKKFPGKEEYDDNGSLFLTMDDGSEYLIEGGCIESWTGKSEGEYPTIITIQRKTMMP